MRFPIPPLEALFLRRYKRFFVDVELPSGEVLTAHCPNTGSLLGCLEPGAPVWLRDSGDPKRKLRYTFQAIRVGSTWVNVDTSLPNRVVREAAESLAIPGLERYSRVRPEVKYGANSRIDLLLEGEGLPPCYVEVKNTTLAQDKTAMFPDAVTSRGLKHLEELCAVVAAGARAVQLFFVSRGDTAVFTPAAHIDPDYARGLWLASKAGVEVLAFAARVHPQSLELGAALPVELHPEPRKQKGEGAAKASRIRRGR